MLGNVAQSEGRKGLGGTYPYTDEDHTFRTMCKEHGEYQDEDGAHEKQGVLISVRWNEAAKTLSPTRWSTRGSGGGLAQ